MPSGFLLSPKTHLHGLIYSYPLKIFSIGFRLILIVWHWATIAIIFLDLILNFMLDVFCWQLDYASAFFESYTELNICWQNYFLLIWNIKSVLLITIKSEKESFYCLLFYLLPLLSCYVDIAGRSNNSQMFDSRILSHSKFIGTYSW